ncbi:MAG: alanine/glycine:cation symporter family protein [Bacilli bacterium]
MLLVNRFIWLFVMVLILFFGIYFSFVLNGVQFKFKSMFKSVFHGDSSSFGILMTSLAGRIGVGSIAGVCLSIYIGGVGSIFWMWVSTFFCSVITYSEVVLGVKYKCGSYGGPAYYIRDGLGSKMLGGIYSILIIISYIGCFLCIQSNTITKSIVSLFSFSPYVIGLCISVVTFFCIYGGFKSIVGVCNKIVPIMCLIYIGSSVLVLIINYDMIGYVFLNIIKSAFNFKSFFGGFIPMVIIGIQRGIFSNESGIGTSSIVASSGSDFRKQGFIQIFGVYLTTLVICTATAIIILFSDYSSFNLSNINGIELASHAFSYHFGNIGIYILVISVILFSFSTILTGYYYGESSFNYFFDRVNIKFIYILRGITLVILFIGCILPSGLIWAFVDILVGIMVIINLYAIWRLRNKIE